MTRADWPYLGCYPKPFYVVHLSLPGHFASACGRWGGSRRFDPARGTFCQDTAHLTLTAQQPEGFAACPDCLAYLASATDSSPAARWNATCRAQLAATRRAGNAHLTSKTERNPT